MRRSSSLFMQNSKPIVRYDNVSYDTGVTIPAQYGYIYFVPLLNSHFTFGPYPGGNKNTAFPISPYELYNPILGQWDASYFTASFSYPDGNVWGRYYAITMPEHIQWTSTGNLGYKTIAEYNDLLSQMDGTTKRNLQGDRRY